MEIIYAGASHYGVQGYCSLCDFFDKIYLIRDNIPEILAIKRECDEIIDDFDSSECQVVFLCGYAKFISVEQLTRKTYINIHGALLPKYRGMHPTFYAIMNGEEKLGITFHLVDKYMDAGDVLAQYEFDYTGQNVCEINDEIDLLVEKHAGEVLSEFVRGKIIPYKQNEEDALYGAKRNLEDCLVDFNMTNVLLRRYFKALTPSYPYPMLRIRGELYEILPEAHIVDKEYYGPIGRAVNKSEGGTWIKVQDGFLIVSKVRKYGTTKEEILSDIVPMGYRFI